jgi:hypothetical protein
MYLEISQDPQRQSARRAAPRHVPDLVKIEDVPICELPAAAIGPSPVLLLVDCLECLRRTVAATEARLVMLRELLAKAEVP